ncbi:MAG: hypothetical protein ACTHMV_14320 [Chitinophagaceae bacterium]
MHISTLLPNGFSHVDNPDHPFTFDGPDALVYDRKGLLAIFEIRDNERVSGNKIFARLVNTLIAYPPRAKMILIYSENISPELSDKADYLFDRIIEKKELKKARSLIKDDKPQGHIREIKHTQSRIFSLQSQTQLDNIRYIRKREKFSTPIPDKLLPTNQKAKYLDRIYGKEYTVRANIFESDNQFYGQKRLQGGSSDLEGLQAFFEFAVNAELLIDRAVPYYRHLSKKVLNLDKIPRIKLDPLKPIRIASLFGWRLTNSSNFPEMKERIQ